MLKTRAETIAAALFGMVLLAASAAMACPTCDNSIKDDPVAMAFSWTTLFLMAMPFALVGSMGGWIVMTYWRAARNGAELMPSSAPWAHASAEKESER